MDFEDIYVTNAGCVLLHPFFTKLFDNLEFLEGDQFKNENSRFKAITLIHYLTTKETLAEEYGLVLPKILCGLNPTDHINFGLELSHEDQEEAERLLEAVVSMWGALGEVSVEALREGFLQRMGKLSILEQGWKLQIEKKPLDILLNTLPWTIGVVKTQWMHKMLTTDWG